MKKILYSIIITILIFNLTPITSYAKVRTDVIKNGGFTTLSDEDMQDTIQALTDKIAKDCKVQAHQTTSCYDWKESATLAYNTLYGCNIICVNLSGFRTTEDADAAGETVEYHLVKTLAHEVRHSYQWEHQNDDTDYGKACKQGFAEYESYNGNREAYYMQWIEADAEDYAIKYANKYFKKGK